VYPYGPDSARAGARPPGFRAGRAAARIPARERPTAGIFIPKDADEPVAVLEAALRRGDRGATDRLRLVHERGVIASRVADQIVEEACAKGVVTQDEEAATERAKPLRREVVMVDDFPRTPARPKSARSRSRSRSASDSLSLRAFAVDLLRE
jgi:hypothetical protein